MTDELVFAQAYEEEVAEAQQVLRAMQERGYWEAEMTVDDALNVANLARHYGDAVSPELAAAVGQAHLPYDLPTMDEIVTKDVQEQDRGFWGHVGAGVRGVTRFGLGAFDWVQEEGIKRPVKTLVRTATEGEDPFTAWMRTGASDMTRAISEASRGEPVNVGSGWFFGSDLAHEQPGFRESARAFEEQGLDTRSAMVAASEEIYSEIGRPITYEQQRARQSTIIHRTRPDGTVMTAPFSPGAAAAIVVSEPGSVAYNLMSGLVDATYTIATDPFNVPGDEIAKALKARKLIVPSTVDVGRISGGRYPLVRGVQAQDFLLRGDGRKLVSQLAQEKSFSRVWDLIGDFGHETVARVALTNDEAKVANLLRPHLGRDIFDVSPYTGWRRHRRALGARMVDSRTGVMSRFNRDSAIAKSRRRWAAGMGEARLNPMDIDESMKIAYNWMKTAGFDVEDIDRIMRAIGATGHTMRGARRIRGEIARTTSKRLDDIYEGDGVASSMIFKKLFDTEDINRLYDVDATGYPINSYGQKQMEILGPGDTKVFYPFEGASLDSEMAEQVVSLPSHRDVRMATSQTRVIRNKFRKHLGRDPFTGRGDDFRGLSTVILDAVTASFRVGALLRFAWPMRFVPEEWIRWQAAGYREIFATPGSYFAYMLGRPKQALDELGNPIEEFSNAKALGAGGFQRDIRNEAVLGTRFDATRSPWRMASTLEMAEDGTRVLSRTGRMAVARELIQLTNSKLARRVAQVGKDQAYEFFRNTPEGRAILKEIAGRASEDNVLRQFKDFDFLEDRMRAAVGRGYTDIADSYRKRLDDLDAKLKDKLAEAEVRVQALAGGETYYFDPKHNVWKDRNGTVLDEDVQIRLNMDHPSDKERFHLGSEGSDRVRRFIADGGADQTGHQWLTENMTERQFSDLEDWVQSLYTGTDFVPPAQMKVPIYRLEPNRLKTIGRKYSDMAFEFLGAKPTINVIRHPFAVRRYHDNVARMYWGADEAVRKQLDDMAARNNMTKDFEKFKRQHRPQVVEGSYPMPSAGDGFTFDEVDEISRRWALEQTKFEFYDLAERQQWADAARLVFPFGDAFKELTSTWLRNLGGVEDFGVTAARLPQATRNWRRIERAHHAQNTQQNGFFAQDQFGNEVFNFPSFALASALPFFPGADISEMQTQVRPDALLFLDPTSIRGMIAPGVGPVVQIPANIINMFKIPRGWWTDMANTAVYGDFQPPEGGVYEQFLDPVVPTYSRKFRRLMQAWSGDEMVGVYADEAAQTIISLMLADPSLAENMTASNMAALLKEVKGVPVALAAAETLNAMFLPAGTQHFPAIEADDLWNMEQPTQLLTVSALAADMNAARDYYGNDDEARLYIIQRYGLDPLLLAPKTSEVLDRPLTKASYEKLDANPELRNFDLTLMAFVGEDPSDDFYMPAWRQQIRDGDREYLTPDIIVRMISQRQGNRAYEVLTERYDERLAEAELRFSGQPNAMTEYRRRLDAWKQKEQADLSAQYYSWDEDYRFDTYGRTERPTYQMLLEEVVEIGTKGTTFNDIAHQHNPEMARFYEDITEAVRTADELAMAMGKDEDWWRTATAELEPGQPMKLQRDIQLRDEIRDAFEARVNAAISLVRDERNKHGATWLWERLLSPMSNEWWDPEATLLFAPRPIPEIDATIETRQLEGMRSR